MTTTHTPGLGDAAPCNASLIAAAPDLLNVLEEALEAIDYFHEHEGATGLPEAARAAIAKATGGQA